MKKIVLFAFKSTGSIDLLISCALIKNLPFRINKIEIVTDNLDYCLKIIDSDKELFLIKEKFNIDIFVSPFILRNKRLLIFSGYLYKLIKNLSGSSELLWKINNILFIKLNFKNINKNLLNFKNYLCDEYLIFIERKKWDIRHINVINTFNKKNIYAFPDSPIRHSLGFTNNSIFTKKKNIILILPKGCKDINENRKIFFEPIAGNKDFYKKIQLLKDAYQERYGSNKAILVILQKYSDKKNDYELTNWNERKEIEKYLTPIYFPEVFSKNQGKSNTKIILSSHPGLTFQANHQDKVGNIKTNKLLKSKNKYSILSNKKLSIANSISANFVYSEFSSAIYYFINSKIIIKRGLSYQEFSKDYLLFNDYETFLNINKKAKLLP